MAKNIKGTPAQPEKKKPQAKRETKCSCGCTLPIKAK